MYQQASRMTADKVIERRMSSDSDVTIIVRRVTCAVERSGNERRIIAYLINLRLHALCKSVASSKGGK
jgi:hypothetical protein